MGIVFVPMRPVISNSGESRNDIGGKKRDFISFPGGNSGSVASSAHFEHDLAELIVSVDDFELMPAVSKSVARRRVAVLTS